MRTRAVDDERAVVERGLAHALAEDHAEPVAESGALSRSPLTLCRIGAIAGMSGAALFVAAFLVQGWLRPGYSATSMFVSELALGPLGWIQVVSFVVSGSLMFLFGRGLGVGLAGGVSGRAGPMLIQVIGIALVASGPFITDPLTVSNQHSVHGIIHGLFGAVVFSLAPASCFVMYRRFRRDSSWRGLAVVTLVVGVGLTVGVLLLKLAEQPTSALFAGKGLVQRAILIGCPVPGSVEALN